MQYLLWKNGILSKNSKCLLISVLWRFCFKNFSLTLKKRVFTMSSHWDDRIILPRWPHHLTEMSRSSQWDDTVRSVLQRLFSSFSVITPHFCFLFWKFLLTRFFTFCKILSKSRVDATVQPLLSKDSINMCKDTGRIILFRHFDVFKGLS